MLNLQLRFVRSDDVSYQNDPCEVKFLYLPLSKARSTLSILLQKYLLGYFLISKSQIVLGFCRPIFFLFFFIFFFLSLRETLMVLRPHFHAYGEIVYYSKGKSLTSIMEY